MAYASVISSSAVIRGNVRGDGSLEILGRVEGDVGVTGDLSIGPDAVVVGALSGARVIIGGSVQGDVTGTEVVLIGETGRVIGDLSAPRIGMSEGAHVRGGVRTDGMSAAPAASVRGSAQRNVEPRPAPVLVERPAPRPVAASPVAAPAPKAEAKKAPPPPIIHAPRPGARARKKVARR
jgi:cytoskeletal protein CcmA (bactofilin family)